MTDRPLDAVLVLGCRVVRDPASGRLVGALGRRVAAGIAFARAHGVEKILVTGGRAWGGVLEADAMAEAFAREGLAVALRERRSRSTRQNAEYSAALLGPCRVAVVTCDWHLRRASALFRAHGFEVVEVGAPSPGGGLAVRAWRWGRERVAVALDRL